MGLVLVSAAAANNLVRVRKDGWNAAVQHFHDAMQYDHVWHSGNGGSARPRERLGTAEEGGQCEPETEAMTATMLGDTSVRAIPSRSMPRRSVARLIAVRDVPPRRRVNAFLIGLDDAGLATAGCDRRALAEAGRGQFPL
jgi:hypothetical protein